MGKFKDVGDPAAALAEECAEVIQCINKKIRFGGDWNQIPEGKEKSRIQELQDEMGDLIYQYNRFMNTQSIIGKKYIPFDNSHSCNLSLQKPSGNIYLAGTLIGHEPKICTIISNPFLMKRINCEGKLKETEMVLVEYNNQTYSVMFDINSII